MTKRAQPKHPVVEKIGETAPVGGAHPVDTPSTARSTEVFFGFFRFFGFFWGGGGLIMIKN